jgi:phosphatidylinositol phospholipase C, gamma-1
MFRFLTFYSLAALSKLECDNWISGLDYLLRDTSNASYSLLIERWLRREFYIMENIREK